MQEKEASKLLTAPRTDRIGRLPINSALSPTRRTVRRTSAALEANGFTVLRASDAAEAKEIVLGLIPDGAQVHHGASQTLEFTGITAADGRVGSIRSHPARDLQHGSPDPGVTRFGG